MVQLGHVGLRDLLSEIESCSTMWRCPNVVFDIDCRKLKRERSVLAVNDLSIQLLLSSKFNSAYLQPNRMAPAPAGLMNKNVFSCIVGFVGTISLPPYVHPNKIPYVFQDPLEI